LLSLSLKTCDGSSWCKTNGTVDRHLHTATVLHSRLGTQHAGFVVKEDAGVVVKPDGALKEDSKESEGPPTSLSAPSLSFSFKISTLNLPLEKRIFSFVNLLRE
jgi:hypothetical protein